MEGEIYHQINVIDCECSINSIDYDATDLKIMLVVLTTKERLPFDLGMYLPIV